MFDRIFAAAYIDNETRSRVLGVKLRPFCPWHLFLLQVCDSPFLHAGEVRLYHLRRAVGICRLQYPHNRTRLPITIRPVTMKWLEAEVLKFLNYIANYMQKPEFTVIPQDLYPKGDRAPPPRANPPPEVISLVFDAAKGANCSIAEAWNMPLGQAYIAQSMRLIELGAHVDFMDEDERAFEAAMRTKLSENGKS